MNKIVVVIFIDAQNNLQSKEFEDEIEAQIFVSRCERKLAVVRGQSLATEVLNT